MKEFDSLLSRLAYRFDIRQIFNDLLDLLLYSLIITDDLEIRRNPLSQYNEDEQQIFIQLMNMVGELMEKNGNYYDAFGDIFMEHLSFGKNGQFFTPQPICDMMAQMNFADAENNKSVCDPTCGSGRTLLALAKINRELWFFGSDIDLTCVKMTVLNLALNNLRGEIVHGNPLTLDVYASFKIGRDFLTGFPIVMISKNTDMFGKLQATQEVEEKPKQKPKENPKETQAFKQLKFFEDV